jgi:arylsulfatase A-like enzyme
MTQNILKRLKNSILIVSLCSISISFQNHKAFADKPNIILVMSDDQGWGQTSYNNHPILKTPNLDNMASNGLRFNRFYAGAPVCSPTRASVLTGRTNDRTGVFSHGYPMRRQEKTIAMALKQAGYSTAHFGKWHLNGLRGPGVPILKDDKRNPGAFGFDEWLSVTNFFDVNPIMSRNGEFEEFKGESSQIIVNEALKFIEKEKNNNKPLFIVIWFGSPHSPWMASEKDKEEFKNLEEKAQNHYAELVNIDKSVGNIRKGLRDMEIADNTLLWFNSDNGGLPPFGPETVGGLRGFKNQIYEGGIRVPCVIEWPEGIKQARITDYPAATMDIFPTIADIVGIPKSSMNTPIDGISIKKLFTIELKKRDDPIPFRHVGRGALIDNNYKILTQKIKEGKFELYDLEKDPNETDNLIDKQPEIAKEMIAAYTKWTLSVDASIEGNDYPNGLIEPDPKDAYWKDKPQYKPYLEDWSKRPEYKSTLNGKKKTRKK